jgi:hypothetical protein
MAQTSLSHNSPQKPDPQKDGTSGDDITHPQEQQTLPVRLPKSLIEWLAHTLAPAASAGVNQRYLALNFER